MEESFYILIGIYNSIPAEIENKTKQIEIRTKLIPKLYQKSSYTFFYLVQNYVFNFVSELDFAFEPIFIIIIFFFLYLKAYFLKLHKVFRILLTIACSSQLFILFVIVVSETFNRCRKSEHYLRV